MLLHRFPSKGDRPILVGSLFCFGGGEFGPLKAQGIQVARLSLRHDVQLRTQHRQQFARTKLRARPRSKRDSDSGVTPA